MVKVTDMLAAQARVAAKRTGAAVEGSQPVAAPAPASEAPSPPSAPEIAVSAHVPAKVIDPPAPPQRGTMETLAREQHKRHGTPDDEPIAIIHKAFGAHLDEQRKITERFDKILSKFGPDAAKEAAEAAAFAANQAVSDGVSRITWQVSASRAARTLALCAIVAGVSWYIRGTLDRETNIGYVPPEMANVLVLQDWSSQWDRRIPQRPRNGYEWALMPVITKAPALE